MKEGDGKQEDVVEKSGERPAEEGEDEEMAEEENAAAESGPNQPVVGGFVYLVDRCAFAMVKAKADEDANKYECVIKNASKGSPHPEEETQTLTLQSITKKAESTDQIQELTLFSNQIYLQVYVVLNFDKKYNMTVSSHADDKMMAVAEQLADLFGETKYSISFFMDGQKINLNDKLADLGLGYYRSKSH